MTHAPGKREREEAVFKLDIYNVERTPEIVEAGGLVRILFRISGALGPFQFPFENSSLTEKTIIFMKEE